MIDLDDCDPQVGPPRVQPGDTARRWTVVRQSSPQPRSMGARRGPIYQRRVRVRCVCGEVETIWEKDLITGRSTGCRSKTCMRTSRAEVEMQVKSATIEAIETAMRKYENELAEIEEQIDAERKSVETEIAKMRAELERQVEEALERVEAAKSASSARMVELTEKKRAFEVVIADMREAG